MGNPKMITVGEDGEEIVQGIAKGKVEELVFPSEERGKYSSDRNRYQSNF